MAALAVAGATRREVATISTPAASMATTSVPDPTVKALRLTPIQRISGVVQTAIGTVFNAVLRVVEGPPKLPAGSTVTVKSATLHLPCGNGNCKAPADWYFPDDPNPAGLIYLQHGSYANSAMYSYTAADLAESTGSIVVVPTITDFYQVDGYWLGGKAMQHAVADLFTGDRAALTASASAAAGHAVALPQRVALVGHSAGGDLVTGAAADMVAHGDGASLAGVVLLDGYAADPAQFTIDVKSLPATVPFLLISSPPSYFNQLGATAAALVAARPDVFTGIQLNGGSHVDGMRGGNPIIQFAEYAAAGFPKPPNAAAVGALSAQWINDMFSGDAVSGSPGLPVSILTDRGTATGYALPAPPTKPSVIEVLLVRFTQFITKLLS